MVATDAREGCTARDDGVAVSKGPISRSHLNGGTKVSTYDSFLPRVAHGTSCLIRQCSRQVGFQCVPQNLHLLRNKLNSTERHGILEVRHGQVRGDTWTGGGILQSKILYLD